jgi:hypothetical protein
VRIRVRISPHQPLACYKRRLNGFGPPDEAEKNDVPCHSRCGIINIHVYTSIPPC